MQKQKKKKREESVRNVLRTTERKKKDAEYKKMKKENKGFSVFPLMSVKGHDFLETIVE